MPLGILARDLYRRYRARKLRILLKVISPSAEEADRTIRQYIRNHDRELMQKAKRARRATN